MVRGDLWSEICGQTGLELCSKWWVKICGRALGRAYLYANDARREIIFLSDENPVDRPPGSNLARLDEVALEDCAAGRLPSPDDCFCVRER